MDEINKYENQESISEYSKHLNDSNPICEYNVFSFKSVCNMKTIELWLERYRGFYDDVVTILEDKRYASKLNSIEVLMKKDFEVLYGKLDILSRLYKKEAYFRQQLDNYNGVKDSVMKLENWFSYQVENKNEYQLFSSVFYDSRELTHYRLELDELTLNPEDFKYTLKYMGIIEEAKAIHFEGKIKSIDDLEVYKKTENTRAYTRRKIVLSIDDFCCSEFQVVFTDGRVKHLDNLSVGQFVKVFARLTGGELQNSEGTKGYKHHLYGWRVEILDAKPKVKKNTKEMDLYYKYILPLPF
tara:strand:+ start:230354 stop:231247 length:894 start_codon:yes stop_codon:yes gene_type:complete